jgi:hypothetical protein
MTTGPRLTRHRRAWVPDPANSALRRSASSYNFSLPLCWLAAFLRVVIAALDLIPHPPEIA